MWTVGEVVALHDETPTARSLTLKVAEWPGHIAGQHVDVRLTAPDGYSAVRSYSIASAPNTEGQIEITVDRLPNGEVSPYLTQQVAVGDPLEIRGPIGGWFIWRTSQTEPVQLIAGGSGIVPLMAMIRSHEEAKSRVPFRLLYSAREPGAVFYRQELTMLADAKKSVDVRYAFTRVAPKGWPGTPRRIDGALVAEATWPAADMATFYVCGPTSFVESLASYLRINGNSPDRIKTERFGETGSSQ